MGVTLHPSPPHRTHQQTLPLYLWHSSWTVYSLHLLCPQGQATSIPGIEHQSLILSSLPVLPQWPCWPGRLTTTLGTKTSVKPSNSPGEIQLPPTAYEQTCLVRIWLPSRDTLSSWQSRSCQALSSLRPPCSCLPWPEHLPSPLSFVPVRGDQYLSCSPLFPSIQHSTWGHWGAQYIKALMKKPGF